MTDLGYEEWNRKRLERMRQERIARNRKTLREWAFIALLILAAFIITKVFGPVGVKNRTHHREHEVTRSRVRPGADK